MVAIATMLTAGNKLATISNIMNTDRKAYKQVIENIHEALKKEFIELKSKADVLFSATDQKDNLTS